MAASAQLNNGTIFDRKVFPECGNIEDLCPLGSLLAGIKYHSYSAVN